MWASSENFDFLLFIAYHRKQKSIPLLNTLSEHLYSEIDLRA